MVSIEKEGVDKIHVELEELGGVVSAGTFLCNVSLFGPHFVSFYFVSVGLDVKGRDEECCVMWGI